MPLKLRIIILTFLLVTGVWAQKTLPVLGKTGTPSDDVPLKTTAFLTVGDWQLLVKNNGILADKGLGIFPKKTTSLISSQGILWGGWFKDAQTGRKIEAFPRVNGVYYDFALQPGWIQEDGTPVDVNNPRVKIYFIRKDWRELTPEQLKQEAAYYFNTDTNAVNASMMSDLKNTLAENWKNWPVDLGAPYNDVNGNGVYDPVFDADGYPDLTQGDYPGVANADQVVWLVANDANSRLSPAFSDSLPHNLELQLTLWTYKGNFTPLSKTVFARYRLINKTRYVLDSMFVGIYSDPDIGYYNDDLVGCDTTRDLWFAYNGKSEDAEFEKFGLTPPALGYTLLAGPMVKSDAPGDEAWSNFQRYPGYKNLGMTSFAYEGYSLYEPYPLGSEDFAKTWYNVLRGYIPTPDLDNPTPWAIGSGPRQGEPTHFPFSGDPVSDPSGLYGDVDGAGWNLLARDRRMCGNTGPFTMQPGEAQEILLAISGGMGPDNRKGIVDLRAISDLLHLFKKNDFQTLRVAPAPPDVKASSFVNGPIDNHIVLNWGWNTRRLQETEESQIGSFKFEGYMVYQLPSPQTPVDDPRAVRIATFDLKDNVYTVFHWKFSQKYGQPILVPLANGTDSGIIRHLIVDHDYLRGKPLYRGSTYYFAVTAYNYNSDNPEFPSFESEPAIVSVTVQGPKPGERYEAQLENELDVQTNKKSDMICKAVVVDPSATTGHEYEIFFTQDSDTTSPTYGQWLWNLRDKTANRVVVSGQRISEVRGKRLPYPPYSFYTPFEKTGETVADGLALYVQMPVPTFKCIVEVANRLGPIKNQWDVIDSTCEGANVWHSLSAASDLNRFYLSAGGDDGSIERLLQHIANAQSHDFEMRFTQRGGIFTWWYEEGNLWAQVPFEFWDVGVGTYHDTMDDVRCLTGGYSAGITPGVFDYGYTDPAFGYRATDWISVRKPLNPEGSYEAYARDVTSGAFTKEWWDHSVPILDNLIICDFGGAGTLPETGTVIRFITTKGPSKDLKFWFTAPVRIENDLALAQKDVEKINVFPNPYYGGIQWSPNGPVRGVTFNHLPQHAIIRIFTLNGVRVRKFEKRDDTQFLHWDLKSQNGSPVASGLYIVHIDMPELKKTKKLKLMIIQGEH